MIIKEVGEKAVGENVKTIYQYSCDYCSFVFEQAVGSYETKTKKISDKVQCPNCKNFLKTWI